MNKKLAKLGAASLLAVGAGSVLMKKNRMKSADPEAKAQREKELKEFRNTERGKQAKNSKGIYYSNGNYEAFARPEKPEGVDDKSAYIVGSGLAALAAACFLVRDGQMKGGHIHILEAMDIAGGACDGIEIRSAAMSCAAVVRWKTISSVCGICSTVFRPWRYRELPYWTSITG